MTAKPTNPWMDIRRLIRLGAVAVLVIGTVMIWLNRNEWAIQHNLSRLRRLVEKSENESALTTAVRAREISLFFTAQVNVSLGAPLPKLDSREEVAAIALHVRSTADTIQLKIRDRRLTLAPSGTSATMSLTAEGIVRMGGQTDRDIREFRLDWIKRDGRWLISGLGSDESIRRPASLPSEYF
jgi:hypothetical protein